MVNQSNSGVNQELNEEQLVHAEAKQYVNEHIKKFEDLDSFLEKASDHVDYYYSIQDTYTTKEDFVEYLKGLLSIYVSFFSGELTEEDEQVDNILEYIEDNYDFILYFGEDINPTYKKINNPQINYTRTQLEIQSKKRLMELLSLSKGDENNLTNNEE